LKPNAEPTTIATSASQPIPYCAYLGSEKNGLSTKGIHIASTGRVITELGMNRNAMMAMNDQEKKVWTIHLWRVALSTVDEIHHPRMSAARAPSFTQRTSSRFRVNHLPLGAVSMWFSSISLWRMP
jgi:hypothetical protein